MKKCCKVPKNLKNEFNKNLRKPITKRLTKLVGGKSLPKPPHRRYR